MYFRDIIDVLAQARRGLAAGWAAPVEACGGEGAGDWGEEGAGGGHDIFHIYLVINNSLFFSSFSKSKFIIFCLPRSTVIFFSYIESIRYI